SPDGTRLASASDDQTVRLWDLAAGSEIRAFQGHTDAVWSVAFSPDGARLASASAALTLRIWHLASGAEIRAFKGHTDSVWSVAFSPDGAHLASASADNTIRIWDIATGACLAVFLPAREGWAAFTPDGRYRLGGDVAGAFWHVIGLCRF